MEGLLGFLLIAGLFFLMMRFGCGPHAAHGGHGSHGDHKDHGDGHGHDHDIMHKDPVCNMDVDPHQGYGKMYQGQLYRFCSRNCLDKFEDNPERYLSTEGGEP